LADVLFGVRKGDVARLYFMDFVDSGDHQAFVTDEGGVDFFGDFSDGDWVRKFHIAVGWCPFRGWFASD
jgi:hypothetical protein